MIDIDAHVDLKAVENALRRLQLAGKDLRPIFKASRKSLRADQREHAKEQRGPDGKWKPLDPDTIAKRTRQGKGRRHLGKRKRKRKRFPRLLGRLPRSFDVKYTKSAIRAVSRVKWSGAHQHKGSTARVGRGAQLPDRTFLWASTGLIQEVAMSIVDFMAGAWEKTK